MLEKLQTHTRHVKDVMTSRAKKKTTLCWRSAKFFSGIKNNNVNYSFLFVKQNLHRLILWHPRIHEK